MTGCTDDISKKCDELTTWIDKLLNDPEVRGDVRVFKLESWLEKYHHEAVYLQKDFRAKVKETRLAWIDWMIAYWEAKESK